MRSAPDPRIVLALAARGQSDPRTARAFLEGRAVRGQMLNARLREAAQAIGVELAPPSTTAPASAV